MEGAAACERGCEDESFFLTCYSLGGRYLYDVRTGTQELINPKKSCRRFRCVSGVGTYLGNMPECILTPGDDVPSIPYLQHSVFTL